MTTQYDGLMNFSILREANLKRLPTFQNAKGEIVHSEQDGSDWSLAQWERAIGGEWGELLNLAKKYERGDISYEEFRIKAGKEIADVITYLDIYAYQLRLDVGKVVKDKFNEVSHRVSSPIFIKDDMTVMDLRDDPTYDDIKELAENLNEEEDKGIEPWHLAVIERAIKLNESLAQDLMQKKNFDCQFYEADAEALKYILKRIKELK